MKEFNLPDLAKVVQEKHPNIETSTIEALLTDAFSAMHKDCIEQVESGNLPKRPGSATPV